MNKGPSGPVQSDGGAGREGGTGGGGERRANVVLRALIDEMLEKVRELNRNASIWNEDQIARAEVELEAIMARVRKAALRSGDNSGGG